MSEKHGQVLIVDDNKEFLVALKILLSPYFKDIMTESIPDRIPNIIKSNTIELVLLDMNFKAGIHSGNEGFYWMNRIREIDDSVAVLLITAFGDVETAIRSMKDGATDFIQKNWDESKILSTILSAMRFKKTNNELKRLRTWYNQYNRQSLHASPILKGSSRKMKELFQVIDKVAVTDANILITGENGTGKGLIAQEIHRLSQKAEEILLNVDLGAIPGTLFESELFGFTKGAFTDASHDKPGKFEIASGGTLFLDEIGNLPIQLQAKLLSVLQNREVVRIGDEKIRKVNFRLISATNRDLETMVKNKQFREDLLYRINTVEIRIPAVRERPEDIEELVRHYIKMYSQKYDKQINGISDRTLKHLKSYSWPGNVRELQHAMEKAVILCEGSQIEKNDFNLEVLKSETKYSNTLEDMEKQHILKVLNENSWNMTQTSKELGINRSTLYDKIRKYELNQV